jgi:limonene-1,2-epoxide hydrolase
MTVKDRYNDGPSVISRECEMSPKEIVKAWIEAFNRADADALAALYAENAINHQVAERAVEGRAAIKAMFQTEFARAKMICIPDNLFEDGEWAILEWSDPLGLRGCGFFHIVDGKIAFQRGYWDKLSFLKLHGLKLPAG